MPNPTPGPWKAISHRHGFLLVQQRTGAHICHVTGTEEGDLRLLQAAPDLLSSCKELAFLLETVAHLQGREAEFLPATDKARAIFAKVVNSP